MTVRSAVDTPCLRGDMSPMTESPGPASDSIKSRSTAARGPRGHRSTLSPSEHALEDVDLPFGVSDAGGDSAVECVLDSRS